MLGHTDGSTDGASDGAREDPDGTELLVGDTVGDGIFPKFPLVSSKQDMLSVSYRA